MTDDAPTSGPDRTPDDAERPGAPADTEGATTGADTSAVEETQPVLAGPAADPADQPGADDRSDAPDSTATSATTVVPPPPPGAHGPGYDAPGASSAVPSEQTAAFPPPGATYVENTPGDPDGPPDPHPPHEQAAERAGLTGALAAIGSGLLGAGVLIGTLRGRDDAGELDWSVYGVGLAAVALLLVLSLAAALLARRTEPSGARADLVTWPGIVGILGLAVLLPVGLDEGDLDGQLPYLIGGLIALLSVVGFLLARRPAFAVTTILGLGIAYAKGFSDLFGDSIDPDETAIWVALGVTAFVTIVTILGWAFPSRAITGVAVGVVGVVGIVGSLAGMLLMRLVAGFFAGSGMAGMADLLLGGLGGDPGGEDSGGMGMLDGLSSWSAAPADYESDVAIVLAFASGLVLLWALAAIVSNHSGFKILAISMLATSVPLATGVLAVQHPTWWIAALAAAGAVLLMAGVPLARRRRVG